MSSGMSIMSSEGSAAPLIPGLTLHLQSEGESSPLPAPKPVELELKGTNAPAVAETSGNISTESIESVEARADVSTESMADVPAGTEPNTAKRKLCGVCNVEEYKYKCTRCYLPYCSLACSSVHKTTHPANPTPPPEQPPTLSPEPAQDPNPRLGTLAAQGYQGPFAALDESPELRILFRQYPSLETQLEHIHAATLPPSERGGDYNPAQPSRRREEPWNADKGVEAGKKALHVAQQAGGKDGEGVREYCKLVLQILGKAEAGPAEEELRKQALKEDLRVVEMLLKRERERGLGFG